MKAKTKTMLLTMVMFAGLFEGCSQTAKKPEQQASPQSQQQINNSNSTTDTTTSASIVNNGDAFVEAISKGGTWIVAILNDLKIDKDLSVDGDFKNKKDPPVSQRKIALYAQDSNHKVTARYTLTAPKMTINSIDCAIWNGTFKGDLYVAAKNFQLIGATVDGNVYFTNDDAKSTFKMDSASKITGKQELKK